MENKNKILLTLLFACIFLAGIFGFLLGSTHNNSITQTTTVNVGTESPKLDINKATQNDFESINGIGSVLAQRIIQKRNLTPFKSVNDLLAIKGIGRDKLEAISKIMEVK